MLFRAICRFRNAHNNWSVVLCHGIIDLVFICGKHERLYLSLCARVWIFSLRNVFWTLTRKSTFQWNIVVYIYSFTSYIKLFALYSAKCAWCSQCHFVMLSFVWLYNWSSRMDILWPNINKLRLFYAFNSYSDHIEMCHTQLQSIKNHILLLRAINIGQWLIDFNDATISVIFALCSFIKTFIMSCLENSVDFY